MVDEFLDKLKEKKNVFALVGGLVVLLGLGVYFFFPSSNKQEDSLARLKEQSLQVTTKTGKESQKKTQVTTAKSTITVDIKGAVKHEGVYTLPIDSRIDDVIEKAGGFSEKADRKSVNLAQKLQDETVIYVAAIGENISVIRDSQEGKTSQADKANTKETSVKGKVNLNTATLADLQTISGIGEKKAQDILDYREANGGFKSVDDLKNISGIGDKTFEKLKDLVSVD
ncbi:helix-hairpin-helix domain-containing protein [Streptococcus mutans]|nr:helix-hairpin-helix domain-containing protein [Streptococcus mutans]